MKFLPSQLAYLLAERELRTNLRGLLRYVAFLVALVTAYAVVSGSSTRPGSRRGCGRGRPAVDVLELSGATHVLPIKQQLGDPPGRRDFVLSYASLGAETLYALIRGSETVILGEGVALFTRQVPPALAGRTLQQSTIGARTGLVVIGLQDADRFVTELHSATMLTAGANLVMIGNLEQRRAFAEAFGRA